MKNRVYKVVTLSVILLLTCPFLISPFQTKLTGTLRLEESDVVISTERVLDALEQTYTGHFYENVGQFSDSDIQFYSRIPNGYICFAESRILLWIHGALEPIEVIFEDAAMVNPTGVQERDYRTNFFLGNRGTFTNVRSYTNIRYNDLWSGIDLDYRVAFSDVEYQYEVDAGSDVSDIQTKIVGHESLATKLNFRDYTSYDDSLFEERIDEPMRFSPLEYEEPRWLSSTFLGGSNNDEGKCIEIDRTGRVYIALQTSSVDIPTVNAFDVDRNGSSDIFVAKFNPTLESLEYATYVGGDGDDIPRGFDIDVSGNAYVTGVTYSSDFPISPRNPAFLYQDHLMKTYRSGSSDGFFFKLGQFGDVLKYSTYFGGTNQDAGNDIVVEGSNIAVIVGESTSVDINTTDNAYSGDNSGASDCLIIKVATSLNYYGFRIAVSYLGGALIDKANSVVLDNENNLYITGYTLSTDFPSDTSIPEGTNAFLVKMDTNASSLLYSTVFGGSQNDMGSCVALDSSSNAYVGGGTLSEDFPADIDLAESHETGVRNFFITKFDTVGESESSVVIGGSRNDDVYSIATNTEDYVYAVGMTFSEDFPIVNGIDRTLDGNLDGFLLRFSFDSESITYSTYLGAPSADVCNDIALDSNGIIYATGASDLGGLVEYFPTTSGAYSELPNGLNDAFVFKHGELVPPIVDSPEDITYRVGDIDNIITWTVSDAHPGQYRIVGSGPTATPSLQDWTDTIVIVVDGHNVGTWNYTLVLNDAYGNQVIDTVLVHVEPARIIPEDPIELFLFIAEVGGAIGVFVGAITYIRRRLRRRGARDDAPSESSYSPPSSTDDGAPAPGIPASSDEE